MAIQIEVSKKMVEDVMADWEREHPGHDASEMSGKEFADRMMAKVKASAIAIPEPPKQIQ